MKPGWFHFGIVLINNRNFPAIYNQHEFDSVDIALANGNIIKEDQPVAHLINCTISLINCPFMTVFDSVIFI